MKIESANLGNLSDEEFLELLRNINDEAIKRHKSIAESLKMAGVSRGANRVYANEDIFNKLRKVQEKYGRVSQGLYKKEGHRPVGSTISIRYGTFKRACELAGVEFFGPKRDENRAKGKILYDNEQIFITLRAVAEKHGGALAADQYKESGEIPHFETVVRRFGSFYAACTAAGVTYKSDTKKKFTLERLAEDLRYNFNQIGYVPTTTEYKETGLKPHIATIYNHGLTWDESVDLAGFDYALSKETGKLVYKKTSPL